MDRYGSLKLPVKEDKGTGGDQAPVSSCPVKETKSPPEVKIKVESTGQECEKCKDLCCGKELVVRLDSVDDCLKMLKTIKKEENQNESKNVATQCFDDEGDDGDKKEGQDKQFLQIAAKQNTKLKRVSRKTRNPKPTKTKKKRKVEEVTDCPADGVKCVKVDTSKKRERTSSNFEQFQKNMEEMMKAAIQFHQKFEETIQLYQQFQSSWNNFLM